MNKTAQTMPSPQFQGDSLRPNSTTDRTRRVRRRTPRPGVLAVAIIVGLLVPSWVADAHAQEASKPANDKLTVPPPKDGKKTLVVRVQVIQPYIDKMATRVTYNGMDRVFGIEWKNGKGRGKLRVPDAWVIDEKIVSDIYDDTNAGISMPARYTPVTTPRLYPYLIKVREKWGRQFDDMAQASTKIVAIAMVATLRPTTGPIAVKTAATPKPSPSKPNVRTHSP